MARTPFARRWFVIIVGFLILAILAMCALLVHSHKGTQGRDGERGDSRGIEETRHSPTQDRGAGEPDGPTHGGRLPEGQGGAESGRLALAEALASRGDEVSNVQALIEKAAGEEKERIREALIDRFASDPDPRIRSACLIGMTKFRESARAMLLRALTSDPDRGVRRLAAYCLGQAGSEQEVDALFQAMVKDEGEFGSGRDIALVSIGSLGEIGGEKAADALIAAWNDETLSRGCREQVLFALGYTGAGKVFGILESALKGKEESLRDNAASGLAELVRKNAANPEMVEKVTGLLRPHLNDENPGVRRSVVVALGWTGTREDIRPLQVLLEDGYSSVVSYQEAGQVKQKTVYPVRERAKEAIERIEKRFPPQD